MTHTIQEDFDHFLSYSGYWQESAEVKEKLFKAFEAAWEPRIPKFERLSPDTILLDGKHYRLMSDEESAEFIWEPK